MLMTTMIVLLGSTLIVALMFLVGAVLGDKIARFIVELGESVIDSIENGEKETEHKQQERRSAE